MIKAQMRLTDTLILEGVLERGMFTPYSAIIGVGSGLRATYTLTDGRLVELTRLAGAGTMHFPYAEIEEEAYDTETRVNALLAPNEPIKLERLYYAEQEMQHNAESLDHTEQESNWAVWTVRTRLFIHADKTYTVTGHEVTFDAHHSYACIEYSWDRRITRITISPATSINLRSATKHLPAVCGVFIEDYDTTLQPVLTGCAPSLPLVLYHYDALQYGTEHDIVLVSHQGERIHP